MTRFRTWLINKLSNNELTRLQNENIAYKLLMERTNVKYQELNESLETAQVELDLINYGPGAQDFDTLKQRTKADVCEGLMEEIYNNAHHFITDDGKYIVSIEILKK